MAGEFGVEFKGLSQFQGKLAALPRALSEAERRTTQKGGLLVERRVKDPYMTARGVRGGPFLNRVSGALIASVNTSPPEQDKNGWLVRVGSRKGAAEKYAPVHEFGTNRAGRNRNVTIPARAPYRNALKDTRVTIRELIDTEVRRALESTVGGG